ncbi:SH3 domain-containing protein [Roseovarius aestuariivivens]|uniref:SH3 domain-containing protein n=1 Tax=Roseovarius aestuariivivens TaxID=1888910 RepID=UPI001080001D|nr:SH3 domain-containing protein [Roseovarius aestuariivivens]
MHSKLAAALVAFALALPPIGAQAEADGPDFYRVVGVASDDMLNLRRGPGTNYETIVGLPPGRELDLLSREGNGWCLVALRETPQLQGYVSCRYIGE